MERLVIALLIVTCCLSAHGQFFSKEEQATQGKTKPALKKQLSEAKQKEVYLELCTAKANAHVKSIQIHPVQIHHVPEKRAMQRKKAIDTEASLFGHYKLEIAEQRGITTNCLSKIEASGKEKHWPKVAKKSPTP